MTGTKGGLVRALMVTLVVATIPLLGLAAGRWSGHLVVGIAVAVAFTAVLIGGSLAARHVAESKAKGALVGALSVEALLDVTCLPGDWPELAPETQHVLASGAPMAVTVTASNGFLRVENRMHSRFAKYPFVAQVPLAAVKDVSAGRSRLMLGGSSLTFVLASGQELRVDMKVGQPMAGQLAIAFRKAAASAHRFISAGEGIDVVSQPPPARTPPRLATALVLICFAPFLLAMAGAPDGPFAAVAATATVILAKLLETLRPSWARAVIGKAMVLVSIAFLADAARAGQPLRLVGTAVALAIAAFLLRGGGNT